MSFARFLLLSTCVSLFGADPTGNISGTLIDPAGASVAGAKITATATATGLTREATSDVEGTFLFPLLPIGAYNLSVSATGFRRVDQKGIDVKASISSNVSITLLVGSLAEAVEVTANAELIDTRTGTLRQTIEERQITELPLQGRNPTALVLLAPGTANLSAPTAQRGDALQGATYPGTLVVASGGARGDGVNYLLDGGSNIDHYTNVNNPIPNPDALEEVSIQTNGFSAEFGRAAGAVVNVVTKSGGNQYHGSAFEFLRNGALNSRNFFATVPDTLKRNQFGGGFGGPIKKDKLFFFGSYQGTQARNLASGFNGFALTAAQRNGDFSKTATQLVDPITKVPLPGNQIPASRINPATKKLLEGIPVSSAPDGFLTWSKPLRDSENQVLGRVDYNASATQRLYGRYFFSQYKKTPVTDPSNLLALTTGPKFTTQGISASHTWTIRPTLLNSAIFSFNRNAYIQEGASKVGPPELGINIASSGFPELNFDVSGYFGISTTPTGNFDRQNFHVSDSLHWIKGKHEIAFGGDLLRMQVDLKSRYRMAGRFRFRGSAYSGNALSDLMFGQVERFIQGGGEFAARRGVLGSAFVQDNIRVSRKLNVNLGLRWDPYIPYADQLGRTECYRVGQQSVKFPNAPKGYLFEGEPGCPSGGTERSMYQMAPRIGFSYNLASKTTLRGGFGLFYQPPFVEAVNNMVDSAPWSPQIFLYGVNLSNPYAAQTNPFPAQFAPTPPAKDVAFITPVVGVSFTPDWKPAKVMSFNLTLERQLGANWVARAGYVGSQSRHLSYNNDVNSYNPAYIGLPVGQRPNTQFDRVTMNTSGTNAAYNSLQLGLEKRFAKGLLVSSNFTWSRSIDTTSFTTDLDGINTINPLNVNAYRGPSDYNLPWRSVTNFVYQLPSPGSKMMKNLFGNWQASGLFNFQSGFPISIVSGEDNSHSGVSNDRADRNGVASYTSGTRGQRIAEWFTKSAFKTNKDGTFGNVGRNVLYGPRITNMDMSLVKNFQLKERFKAQLRGEAFNMLNHTQLNNPGTAVTSGGFGRITSAGDPRIFQMALKFNF